MNYPSLSYRVQRHTGLNRINLHNIICRIISRFSITLILVVGMGIQNAPSQSASVSVNPALKTTSIRDKLKSIIIGQVNFKNASIYDIVAFLNQKSKEADSEHIGINFVAQTMLPDTKKVTMNMKDVLLRNLLSMSCELANVSFIVDKNSVNIVPLVDQNALLVRTFILPPTFFVHSKEGASEKINVQQILQEKGILFPPGACAVYMSASSELVIRNTNEQLELIDELVRLTETGNQKIEN